MVFVSTLPCRIAPGAAEPSATRRLFRRALIAALRVMVFVWPLPCRIAPRSCSAFGHSPPFSQGADRRAVRGGVHLDPAVPHRAEGLQSLRPLAAFLAGR
jgi:hypothetical protein